MSVRSANMRAVLADDDDIRNSVSELVSVMDHINVEHARGFRLASLLDPASPAITPRSKPYDFLLEPSHHILLCELLGRGHDIPRSAKFLHEISLNGVCYGTAASSTFKDSSIIFQSQNPLDDSIYAGIAELIFQYSYVEENGESLEEIFILAQELCPIESHLDPYRRYPFGGFLTRQTDLRHLFKASQVKSHFALTKKASGPFAGMIHVLPVDRVSVPLTLSVLEFHSYQRSIAHAGI